MSPPKKKKKATAIGFGGRAPEEVLEVLSKAVHTLGVCDVIPVRSQNIGPSLCRAPHRTFLSGNEGAAPAAATSEGADAEAAAAATATSDLIVYCLPPTVSEYVGYGGTESGTVRSSILNGIDAVAVYDPASSSFLGGEPSDVLSALSGSYESRSSLAGAALSALSRLDASASSLLGPGGRGDTVVVVGSGGREHALAVSLAKSPLVGRVVCCPGNGGTASEGGKVTNAGGGQDNAAVIDLVKKLGADMVVVGPEAPLVDGLVDELKVSCPGVRAFGPTRAGAELEASKAFAKDFLREHGIPTAKYRTFTDADEAVAYVESLDDDDRMVVKASGLAAGKGVLLPTNKSETVAAVREIMSDRAFGDAGDTCVIESYMTGQEASCLALCDGTTAVLMPAAQDHKRALDGDGGLNTGGMGAYAPAPCVTPDLQKEIEGMCVKTVQKMAERGTPYVGVLYAGMMLTPDGPSVLEFNCRFGDPETQVVLPLLETDLYETFVACCDGTLDTVDVRFREGQYAAAVVCAAEGYPEKYPKGMLITGLGDADALAGVKVYHAGTKLDDDGNARCSGGRVLAVTGVGRSLGEALGASYGGVDKLSFVGEGGERLMHYRTDIARRAIDKKLLIGVLGSTRGTALVPVIEACKSGELHAEIVAVVSNRSKAPILDKGRALGRTVTTKFVSSKGLTREQYDAECTSVLLGAGVEYVMLVGYMRILSGPFCDFWAGRCVNVHPSLLPRHAGGMDLAVHQAVIDAGDAESGCTIHEVTEAVDGGPIVAQKVVKVSQGETAESLKSKVQPLEGPAFIEAIKKYLGTAAVSYADAGVSIDAGNKLVELIKPACRSTRRAGCESDLGGFGGLFDLTAAGYGGDDTVLIGATDGVGTKLRIARATGNHSSVGVDLVAMCVNDLIVAGGEPLFFLDYYATGKLDVEDAASVVSGIAEGCRIAGCGLIGGETAEMPSMYGPGDYDLAGFAVGAVRRGGILPEGVGAGDVLLGLPSSGVHSNGFSLVRRLLEKEGIGYGDGCPWDDPDAMTVGDSLLTPTKIYVKSCLPLIRRGVLSGLSHITGGGPLENLPRSMPDGLVAEITGHPPLPSVFKWVKRTSGLDDGEMLRTFNCGVGMVLIVKGDRVEEAREMLRSSGETIVYDLGALVEGEGERVQMKTRLA